ncbi:unnamed protein product [Didymodactylos carnosus]|uniref:Uncharacterized protein n=1 Tax=Didymodactylos carnosus TaxID=1234261 RepID=A0A815A0H8_9BILA|nr:unnamed protein product [Didymodactylos carnosus]CAF1250649.1 unnamed protein product [Didymodactylos carnosus]CAF3902940.1 unnamed protein product [Didymodactylos carnosus]CAF4019589.1 unnamed protein product [Didymodactylos carnosus]
MPHPYVHVEKPRQLHNRPEAPPQAIENDKKKCRQYCHITRKASYNQGLKTFIDVYKIENLQDNLILINNCSTQNELRRALQAASIASQFSIDTENRLDDELSKFLRYGLFDQKMMPTSPRIMVNIQERFGYWMLDREPPVKDGFPREESREEDDDYFELQIPAPRKKKKNNGNGNIAQEWSLQRAAATILNLFVDKSFTISKWHGGLDQRLKTYRDTSLYGRRTLTKFGYSTATPREHD